MATGIEPRTRSEGLSAGMGRPTPPLARQTELDGLRGLAVLAVLGAHYPMFRLFHSGFLGVSVFFVVSGYLITMRLAADVTTLKAPVRSFYIRRLAKLVPPLACLIVLVFLLGNRLWPNASAGEQLTDAVFAVTFTFNLAARSKDFLVQQAPHSLGHTWTLGMEEQFYLLAPWMMKRLSSHNAAPEAKRRLGLWVCLTVVLLSWTAFLLEAAAEHTPANSSEVFAYFNPECRAGEIALGCALAFLKPTVRLSVAATRVLEVSVVVLVLALLVWVAYRPSSLLGVVVPIGLMATLTAVIIYLCRVPGSVLAGALRRKGAVWIGQRSYGLYLFHYPIFLLFPQLLGGPDRYRLLVMLVVTFGLAELSYRYVEAPSVRWASRRQR